MLDAGGIILVCLGCVLTLVIILATACAILRCHSSQQSDTDRDERQKVAQEYYAESPLPSGAKQKKEDCSAAPANGTVAARPAAVHRTTLDNLESKINGVKDEDGKVGSVVLVDETKPSVPVAPRRVTKLSQKTISRPDDLAINTTETKAAAHVVAIQTEHRLSDFSEAMCKMKSGGGHNVIQDEYEILERKDAIRRGSCTVGETHREKNRFADIMPYDDSRVILADNVYINASLIDGEALRGQFIATQGPMCPEEAGRSTTHEEFWQMVWQHGTEAIVMLTDCQENMRTKCGEYWPRELGVSRVYGGVSVCLMAESTDPICDRRQFDLSKGGRTRQVVQYHLRCWRDSRGVDPSHLLDFITRIRTAAPCIPIVVHCSAGVGRTGVFIAVWRLLERARQEGVIDVYSVVDGLRVRRRRMVQTLEQYESIYEAVQTAVREHRI